MYKTVNLIFTDVIQVWKIFHFIFQIYFPSRMKMYVKVIFKVQFSLSSLPSCYAVVSYAQALPLIKTFSSIALNCMAQPAAYGRSRFRISNELPAHPCICLSIYLLVLVSLSLFLGAQCYISRSTLTQKKSQWRRLFKRKPQDKC